MPSYAKVIWDLGAKFVPVTLTPVPTLAVLVLSEIVEPAPLDVVADAVFDGELVPTKLIADTLYVYAVLAASPVSEYVVDVLALFTTMVVNVTPSVDLSILYPVIADPPLFAGAVQERLICDVDIAVAVRPVGGCGGRIPICAFTT